MALTINLLHEEQALLKLRKRDPLKLGLYALAGVAFLFVAYYAYRLVGSTSIKHDLEARQAEWARQEPKAATAMEQDKIINEKLGIATLVGERIDNRFYWAPLLAILQKSVPPNVQILSFAGSSDPKDDKISIILEGLAAGTVPRTAAEQFRTSLADALGRSYKGAAATFHSLDETASTVLLNGKQTPTARFSIDVRMDKTAHLPEVAETPIRRAKHS